MYQAPGKKTEFFAADTFQMFPVTNGVTLIIDWNVKVDSVGKIKV